MLRRVLLGGVVAAGLAMSGAGVTAALMDIPQDAVSVADPVGDALRDRTVAQPAPAVVQPSAEPTVPAVPAAAPEADVVATQEEVGDEVEDDFATEEAAEEVAEIAVDPGVRRRYPVAIIQAIDKTTTETMRFEVEVGGRPVRFSRSLVFKVRACEVTSPGELTEDSVAYLEIGVQPRSQVASNVARQVFKGWMFASSPSVNAMQNPSYDAWVIGCRPA